MLSQQDVDRIRRLNDELDQAKAELEAAHRETEAAKRRLRQVRDSIRTASRTRLTSWLTNSDPEEHRRYRDAKTEYQDQQQLIRQLTPRIAQKDARITELVKECLENSHQPYRGLVTRTRLANEDRESCERSRAEVSNVRKRVDAALIELQRLGRRDTKEARKATDRTASELADEMSALKKHLTTLIPRLRAYGSVPTRQIQLLRTEFSGCRVNINTRRSELTAARSTLTNLDNSLGSLSKRIVEHSRGYEKKRLALVQKARAQALGE
jgi:predicted  nucleic acid-binding Zn-ribbon protein